MTESIEILVLYSFLYVTQIWYRILYNVMICFDGRALTNCGGVAQNQMMVYI